MTNDISKPSAYLAKIAEILANLPSSGVDAMVAVLLRAYDENRTVFVFGNGGSAALASHVACDLGKGTAVEGGRRFRVLSLTDSVPLITAWANDTRYDDVFAQQLATFMRPGDIAFAISGSGNSPNVLNALDFSRKAGGLNIGLTGFCGGKMLSRCDVCVVVPSDNMQFIEDAHVAVSHSVFTAVRDRLHRTARPHSMAVATAGTSGSFLK